MSTNPKKQTDPLLKNKTPNELHELKKEFDTEYRSIYGYDEGTGTKNTGPKNEETDLGMQTRKMYDEKYDKFGRPREKSAPIDINSDNNNMYQYYGGKKRRKRSKKVRKKSKKVRKKSKKTCKRSRKSKHTKKHRK